MNQILLATRAGRFLTLRRQCGILPQATHVILDMDQT